MAALLKVLSLFMNIFKAVGPYIKDLMIKKQTKKDREEISQGFQNPDKAEGAKQVNDNFDGLT